MSAIDPEHKRRTDITKVRSLVFGEEDGQYVSLEHKYIR
jgi:hypothetical protein